MLPHAPRHDLGSAADPKDCVEARILGVKVEWNNLVVPAKDAMQAAPRPIHRTDAQAAEIFKTLLKSRVIVELFLTRTGCKYHQHRAPLKRRLLLHHRDIRQFFRDVVQILNGDLRIITLSSAEADPNSDFFAFLQPPAGIPHFEALVMIGGLRTETDFFDLDGLLSLLGFFLFFGPFVHELPVIHHPANWRVCLGGNFDQIKIFIVSGLECLLNRHHSNILSVSVDQTHFWGANLLIYPIV